jgi:hypothetical protein
MVVLGYKYQVGVSESIHRLCLKSIRRLLEGFFFGIKTYRRAGRFLRQRRITRSMPTVGQQASKKNIVVFICLPRR